MYRTPNNISRKGSFKKIKTMEHKNIISMRQHIEANSNYNTKINNVPFNLLQSNIKRHHQAFDNKKNFEKKTNLSSRK